MAIPTENVGSLPRPAKLQTALRYYDLGKITREQLTRQQDAACQDSIQNMEATGSPIVTDGEQRASSFATYPLTDTLAGTGLAENLAADGQCLAIFSDGHHRQLLACKNDSKNPRTARSMLSQFIDLNNCVINRFSSSERKNIGIHTCPGGDCDATHSAEVDYGVAFKKIAARVEGKVMASERLGLA